MGADFIEKATPSFKKRWDRGRVELATADLFTQTPDCTARTAVADIIGNAHIETGDHLIIEVENDSMVGRRGNSNIVQFTKPAPGLIQAVQESCGIAKGTVEAVHKLAGVAEISIC